MLIMYTSSIYCRDDTIVTHSQHVSNCFNPNYTQVYNITLIEFTLKSVKPVVWGIINTIKILLIEDDELASEVLCTFLEKCGFDITPVFTVTDGISHLNTAHFDLLILDINLPDFNGFEVLKNIKNRISLPIIITSAYSDTKFKISAFKYGASDYMVKLLELEARIWVQLGKNCEIKTEEEKNG